MTVASRLRVLIADDNARVLKSVSRLLALDYDVVGTVTNGSGLLEAAQDLHPDIIVLDLSLKDGDSLEACRQVTTRLPDTKVIVFSADHDPEVTARAYDAGASDVVNKLIADALITAVRRLDGHR